MTDPYPLRPVGKDEFETWARMVANTYGEDRTESYLPNELAIIELDRTLAAFDRGRPVAGAAIYSRIMTLPGKVQPPIARISWVGVSPTHRRRGILTTMMRRQLTELHESGGEPAASLNAAEAGIYGRFGYGIATREVSYSGDKRAMLLRPDADPGQGDIWLLGRSRPGRWSRRSTTTRAGTGSAG